MVDAKENDRLVLAKLSNVHLVSERFQMFRSAERFAHIQRDLVRFKDSMEKERPGRAHRLIRETEKAESMLATEHEEMGVSNRAAYREKRGLFVCIALFAVQLVNMVTKAFPTQSLSELPDEIRMAAHNYLAVALLALAAFPLKDFYFSYRFTKLKEDAESVLGEVKKEMLAYLGSTLKRDTEPKED